MSPVFFVQGSLGVLHMLACGMMETRHVYIIFICKSLKRLLLSRPSI